MSHLPDAAARVHAAIVRLYERSGEIPTYRELERELNLSRGGVQRQIRALKRAGYVRTEGAHRSRNLRIVLGPDGSRYTSPAVDALARDALSRTSPAELLAAPRVPLPLAGRVSAGPFALAAPDVDPQPLLVFSGAEVYVDTVRLDCDDPVHGARCGDVLVRELRAPEPGDRWVYEGLPVRALWRAY